MSSWFLPQRPFFLLGLTALAAVVLFGTLPHAPQAAPLHPDLIRDLPEATVHRLGGEPVLDPPAIGLSTASGFREGRRWTGHPRVLVLLVDFPDNPARAELDADHFRELLFSKATVPLGSLRDYYLEATWGRIDITGEVKGPFRLPQNATTYAGEDQGLCSECFPNNSRGLVTHALRAADEAGVDFGAFDNDGPDGVPHSGDDDGILDALLVIHPGPGSERSGNTGHLRSHYWNTTALREVQGILVPDYALAPATDPWDSPEPIGVYAHEFAHILGADDLYDLTFRGSGLGRFSLMSWGMYAANGSRPAAPDPFTRFRLAGLEPETPGADEPRMDLPAINDQPFALRLWTRGEPGPEYFLVENRRPRGIDDQLPGDGLLVYHVDERVRTQNQPSHYRVTLVEADGEDNLLGNRPRNQGTAEDFFPGPHGLRTWNGDTVPSSKAHDGSPTEVALERIGDPGEVVSVVARVGRVIGDGPRPVLRIEPFPDALDLPDVEQRTVRLVVENQGTRLRGGELTLTPLGDGVSIPGNAQLPVASLSALSRRMLDPPIRVDIDPQRVPAGSVPALAARWSTADGDYEMVAALPMKRFRRMATDFESGDAMAPFRHTNAAGDTWPEWFALQSDASSPGGSRVLGFAGAYAAKQDVAVEFGPFAASGPVRLSFRHRFFLQGEDEYAWDGGWVEGRVDGGPWTPLDPDGGYPATMVLTQDNAYPGYGAWSGNQETWVSEDVHLPQVEETVSFRFRFVSDFTPGAFVNMGWWIDNLVVEAWPTSVAAGIRSVEPLGRGAQIEIVAAPFVSGAAETMLRLAQSRPGERVILGDVPTGGLTRHTTPSLRSDQVYTFTLETLQGAVQSSRVRPAKDGEASLVSGLPSVVRAREGVRFEFAVPGTVPADVEVALLDVSGRVMAQLATGVHAAGRHELVWSGRSTTGRVLASGVYFLRVRAGEARQVRRVVVLP